MSQFERKPIIVLNPATNTLINVEPLFDLLTCFEFGEAAKIIDNIIRRTIVEINKDFPLDSNAPLLGDLYIIRDMFQELTECEITVSKPKNKR